MSAETYCWCGMCGFNAIVKAPLQYTECDQVNCPDCESEDMFSLLEFGPEIPDDIIQDEPMQTFNPN